MHETNLYSDRIARPVLHNVLRFVPDDRPYSEARPVWRGRSTLIIGGGHSLTKEQIAAAEPLHEAGRLRVIAVNDSFLWCPWADILYAADSQWWQWTAAGTPKLGIGMSGAQVKERFESFQGERCSIQRAGANVHDPRVHKLRNYDHPHFGAGLSVNPRFLVTARNSGFQAINLAILAGSRHLILLGFDGIPSPTGKTHFFGDHPKIESLTVYEHFRRGMAAGEHAITATGTRVVNASPGTYYDNFPKMSIEQALLEVRQRAN